MPECRLRVHLSHFLTLHMLTIRLTRLHDSKRSRRPRTSTRWLSTRSSTSLGAPGIGPAPRRHAPAALTPWRRPGEPTKRRRRTATTATGAAPTRPREHADCASCPCAPHSPRHPPYPLRLGILHAHSSRHRLTMPCRPPDRSARAAAGYNPVDPSAAHYPTVSGGTCKRATATGCVWLVDTVVCSVNSGCLERLGSSRGATGRAYGADCCPVHGRAAGRVSDPVKPSKRLLPARGRSNVGQ